jgi:uncharacterized LabA/DUF88 family protein
MRGSFFRIFSSPAWYGNPMRERKENNYAFIDSQNLNLGVRALGWQLDYRKFRIFLREKYHVRTAYIFIGFIPSNHGLYDKLEDAGFVLIFKPVVLGVTGTIKGNVDADIVLKSIVEISHYDKAVIVSNDGDFYSLVNYLYQNDKLKIVLSPNRKCCSFLLRGAAKENIQFMDNLRNRIGHI